MPVTNRIGGAQAGDVKFFAGSAAPAGWLKANGAVVSRTAYAALFAAIGTTYGAGDGATTFALPDYRGEFIRCADDGRGVDAGRLVGQAQGHAMQGHRHELALYAGGTGQGIASAANSRVAAGSGSGTGTYAKQTIQDFAGLPLADGVNGTPVTAAETRPRNVAALACIKY